MYIQFRKKKNMYIQESQKLSCFILVHPSMLLENLAYYSTYSIYKIARYGVQLLDLLSYEDIE
jgi:hypothetical protein